MKGIIRWIKRYVFNTFEPGYEYWVRLDKIKIPNYMRGSRIGDEKYKRKWKHFRETGELQSKIILTKDFLLVDGYSSYKIAKIADLGKVPVYFEKD